MNKIPTILLFLGLLLLMACNDPKHVIDTLHRAETLMNEHPDSAWAMLNTLSPDEMGQNSTRAHYALLYTQAQDKTYRDETNDSLISVAVDYYRDTDDVRHKFLSYYYKGRVHFNAKDYLSATSCYMESEQLADAVGDDYLTGLLYAESGRIYRLYYDYPKSLEAYQKAAECYERAGKIRHRNYMWLNQSGAYRNLNQNEDSERLLRLAMVSAKEMKDTTLMELCLGDLVMQHIEQHRMSEAQALYKELQQLLVGSSFGSSSFMGKLAKMYASDKEYYQAKRCIEEGWKQAENRTDSANLYLASAAVSHGQGEDKKAYTEIMKALGLQIQQAHEALQQPVLTAQRDFLAEKLELEAYRLRMEKQLRLLYILFFTLVLVAVVVVLVRKLKKEKEKSIRTIDDLRSQMQQKEKENRGRIAALLHEMEDKEKNTSHTMMQLRSELKKQDDDHRLYVQELENLQQDMQAALQQKTAYVAELFKNWYGMIGLWVYLLEDDRVKESTRIKYVRKEVDYLKGKYILGSKAFRELERQVNAYHDDVMQHFRNEVSLTDKADYRRACYFFAGFSVQTIAWLMDEKVENVYQRRLRLRKQVNVSMCPHKDLFLLMLSK
jgi:tetratricopeptide (TPR) repeat protein